MVLYLKLKIVDLQFIIKQKQN